MWMTDRYIRAVLTLIAITLLGILGERLWRGGAEPDYGSRQVEVLNNAPLRVKVESDRRDPVHVEIREPLRISEPVRVEFGSRPVEVTGTVSTNSLEQQCGTFGRPCYVTIDAGLGLTPRR